jgi:hypothetical protein
VSCRRRTLSGRAAVYEILGTKTCGSKQRRDGKCGTGDGDLRVARDGIEQNQKDGDSHAVAEREYDGQNPVDKCPVDDEIDVVEPVAEYGDAGGNREAGSGSLAMADAPLQENIVPHQGKAGEAPLGAIRGRPGEVMPGRGIGCSSPRAPTDRGG